MQDPRTGIHNVLTKLPTGQAEETWCVTSGSTMGAFAPPHISCPPKNDFKFVKINLNLTISA